MLDVSQAPQIHRDLELQVLDTHPCTGVGWLSGLEGSALSVMTRKHSFFVWVKLIWFFFFFSYRHDGSETLTDEVLFVATDGIHSLEFTLQVKVSVLQTSKGICLCKILQSLPSENLYIPLEAER